MGWEEERAKLNLNIGTNFKIVTFGGNEQLSAAIIHINLELWN